ncbi:hypothetical protein E2320_014012 [Naja naja]|nr:hypothetical protein E2320_014012 [Naja naja]
MYIWVMLSLSSPHCCLPVDPHHFSSTMSYGWNNCYPNCTPVTVTLQPPPFSMNIPSTSLCCPDQYACVDPCRPCSPTVCSPMCVVLPCVPLRSAVLQRVVQHTVVPYHVLLYHVLLYHVLLYRVLPCHVVPYHVLLYHVLQWCAGLHSAAADTTPVTVPTTFLLGNAFPESRPSVILAPNTNMAQDGQVQKDSKATKRAHDTGAQDTGAHDTGPHDTGAHDTGAHDTGPHDTGAHDTGAQDVGPQALGAHTEGPHPLGEQTIGEQTVGEQGLQGSMQAYWSGQQSEVLGMFMLNGGGCRVTKIGLEADNRLTKDKPQEQESGKIWLKDFSQIKKKNSVNLTSSCRELSPLSDPHLFVSDGTIATPTPCDRTLPPCMLTSMPALIPADPAHPLSVLLWSAHPQCAVLLCVPLRSAVLQRVVQHTVVPYHVLLYHVLLYHVLLYRVLPCHVVPYHVLLYHVLQWCAGLHSAAADTTPVTVPTTFLLGNAFPESRPSVILAPNTKMAQDGVE